MARKFYLLQEAIYSSGQTMVSYYNRTRKTKRTMIKQRNNVLKHNRTRHAFWAEVD